MTFENAQSTANVLYRQNKLHQTVKKKKKKLIRIMTHATLCLSGNAAAEKSWTSQEDKN